ncbi:AraC family transcriptional regulator [Paenibacillus sp. GD4]|uniref:AraC family transcriptional regulator n=1 Tax=Paenibacillus sp. GD4 TaxID=3068890 RepID=UPI0027963DA2|nr:AraC family transcriptional regulator [Paenibacillus sp. GD4]MDQ1912690.1 AraC family transcriptional regulator [Paenibacillus sp. GD4]
MKTYYYNPENPYRQDPDVHLLYWGREDCAPGHAVGPMVRDMYKIHFIHSGTGIVQVGDHTYSLGPGQAFLIYPDVLTYYEADRQTPWVYSWLAFRGEQVESILARTRLSPEQPVFPMDVKVMPTMFEQLTLASTQGPGTDLQIKALMYHFFAVLTEVYLHTVPADLSWRKQDAYIMQCIEYLHAHYSEPISIHQLAAYLKLDRKYLSALFKQSVGMPPQQYLLHYRMDKACELLGKGNYSIGEVARSVGYPDSLLFSRMFKKIKGVAPKHYRA